MMSVVELKCSRKAQKNVQIWALWQCRGAKNKCFRMPFAGYLRTKRNALQGG